MSTGLLHHRLELDLIRDGTFYLTRGRVSQDRHPMDPDHQAKADGMDPIYGDGGNHTQSRFAGRIKS